MATMNEDDVWDDIPDDEMKMIYQEVRERNKQLI
jgi:hypothetical protein